MPVDARGPTYAEFAAAVKRALSDFHSADLLAQNPLLRDRIGALRADAGPAELRTLLTDTVETLFGNPRDEKLRAHRRGGSHLGGRVAAEDQDVSAAPRGGARSL